MRNGVRARQSLYYTLDALHALPCGCVAAVFRAPSLDLEFVSLEARGPLCLHVQHQAGRMLELESPSPGLHP
ncbi:MAG: hypothetical protein ACT4QD_25810 [Acidobacteriota bacterium]